MQHLNYILLTFILCNLLYLTYVCLFIVGEIRDLKSEIKKNRSQILDIQNICLNIMKDIKK